MERYNVQVHPDVADALRRLRQPRIEAKVSMQLRQLTELGRTIVRSKETSGPNRGWWRAPLGGNDGSHFYLYWASPHPDPLIRDVSGERTIFVRAVRHHDSTSRKLTDAPLEAFAVAAELEHHAYGLLEFDSNCLPDGFASPFTEVQERFARDRNVTRYLLGAAGGGKTTAVWRAIERGATGRTLYLTWSERLVDDARRHFSLREANGELVYLPADAHFDAYDIRSWWGHLLGDDLAFLTAQQSGERFRAALRELKFDSFRLRSNREDWDHSQIFSELRSELFGSVWSDRRGSVSPFGSFPTEMEYVQHRSEQGVDSAFAAAVHEIGMGLLELQPSSPHHPAHWLPEVFAARRLLAGGGRQRDDLRYHRVVVDEIQDLTRTELEVIVNSVRDARVVDPNAEFFVSGDEAQTVRPSGFRHAYLKNLMFERLGEQVSHFGVEDNLRSPAAIVEVLHRVVALYRVLPPDLRPKKSRQVSATDGTAAQLFVIDVESQADADDLVRQLEDLDDVQGILLPSEGHAGLSPDVASQLSAPEAVKGREFRGVVVFGVREVLERANADQQSMQSLLALRTSLDRLVVSVSRSTSMLAFVDRRSAQTDAAQPVHQLLFGNSPVVRCSPEEFLEMNSDVDVPASQKVASLLDAARVRVVESPEQGLRLLLRAVVHLQRKEDVSSFGDGEVDSFVRDAASTLVCAGLVLASPADAVLTCERTLERLLNWPELTLPADALEGTRRVMVLGRQILAPRTSVDSTVMQSDRTELLRLLTWLATEHRMVESAESLVWNRLRQQLIADIRHEMSRPDLSLQVLAAARRISAGVDPEVAKDLGMMAMATLVETGRLEDAEATALSLEPTPFLQIAEIRGRQGRWNDAAEAYLACKERAQAIRAFREAGDTERIESLRNEFAVEAASELALVRRAEELRVLATDHTPAFTEMERLKIRDALASEAIAERYRDATVRLTEAERVTSLRSVQLKVSEEKLTSDRAALKARGEQLARREQVSQEISRLAAGRDAELRARATELERRVVAVNELEFEALSREATLEDRERELEEKESRIVESAKVLSARENDLLARERKISLREANLDVLPAKRLGAAVHPVALASAAEDLVRGARAVAGSTSGAPLAAGRGGPRARAATADQRGEINWHPSPGAAASVAAPQDLVFAVVERLSRPLGRGDDQLLLELAAMDRANLAGLLRGPEQRVKLADARAALLQNRTQASFKQLPQAMGCTRSQFDALCRVAFGHELREPEQMRTDWADSLLEVWDAWMN